MSELTARDRALSIHAHAPRWSPTMIPDYEGNSEQEEGTDAPGATIRALGTTAEQIDDGDIVDWFVKELPGRHSR